MRKRVSHACGHWDSAMERWERYSVEVSRGKEWEEGEEVEAEEEGVEGGGGDRSV